MVIVGIAVAVLSVLTLISLLALVDHHRTLELIRQRLRAEANPRTIPYTRPEHSIDALGLPAWLEDRQHIVLLFVSTICASCKQIARPIAEEMEPPDRLWIVINAPSAAAGEKWLSEIRLPHGNVTVDSEGKIFSGFGVSVTPAVLILRKGEVVLGQSLASYEHLKLLLSEESLPPSFAKTSKDANT